MLDPNAGPIFPNNATSYSNNPYTMNTSMNANQPQTQSFNPTQPLLQQSGVQPPMPPQQQPIMSQNNYAHGGQVKSHQSSRKRSGNQIAVHMSPRELQVLDRIQGSIEEKMGPDGKRIRSYGALDNTLRNTHIMKHVHHHAEQHRAHGGMLRTAHEDFGRNGDKELAYIGPHLHKLLDKWAGRKTHNPDDGHPEYFSLGGAFEGLGRTLLPVVGGSLLSELGPVGMALGGYGGNALADALFGNGGSSTGAPQSSPSDSQMVQGGSMKPFSSSYSGTQNPATAAFHGQSVQGAPSQTQGQSASIPQQPNSISSSFGNFADKLLDYGMQNPQLMNQFAQGAVDYAGKGKNYLKQQGSNMYNRLFGGQNTPAPQAASGTHWDMDNLFSSPSSPSQAAAPSSSNHWLDDAFSSHQAAPQAAPASASTAWPPTYPGASTMPRAWEPNVTPRGYAQGGMVQQGNHHMKRLLGVHQKPVHRFHSI